MARHDEKPQPGQLPEAALNRIRSLIKSPYFQHIQELKKRIKGKIVKTSIAGHSGYLLYFEDGTWVLCSLVKDKLDWKVGDGEPASEDLATIHNQEYQDGRMPLKVNLPYADEECLIAEAATKTHGKRVTGVAISQNSFNICFPKGWELESHVVVNTDKLILRVFWEQW